MTKNRKIERDKYRRQNDDDFPRIKRVEKVTHDYDHEEEDLLEYMNQADINRWKLG